MELPGRCSDWLDTATGHRPGLTLRLDTTSKGWGLLLGHQRGLLHGHLRGPSHGHGQSKDQDRSRSRAVMSSRIGPSCSPVKVVRISCEEDVRRKAAFGVNVSPQRCVAPRRSCGALESASVADGRLERSCLVSLGSPSAVSFDGTCVHGKAGGMPRSTFDPPFDQFLATAEAVAQARPEVDLELAREVFHEAATLLYNGLTLDDQTDTTLAPLSLGCASISLLRIPASRCAHAPRQRRRLLETCTTPKECPQLT